MARTKQTARKSVKGQRPKFGKKGVAKGLMLSQKSNTLSSPSKTMPEVTTSPPANYRVAPATPKSVGSVVQKVKRRLKNGARALKYAAPFNTER